IPRLIALGRIFSTPEQYGLELADIKNERVVASVEVSGQIDLSLAADIAGVERETIYQLNPGFRQWATHPDGPHSLLLPVTHIETFYAALASRGDQGQVTWDRYVVKPGDTLGKIAIEFRTQVTALQQANNIEGSRIVAGESLLIPRAYNAALPLQMPNAPQYVSGAAYSSDEITAPTRYEVRSGDSLWRIANRYNLTTTALARWNNIDESAVLRPGQILNLAADSTVAQHIDHEVDQTVIYRVRSGDSLARIARQFRVGVSELATWNNISETDLIHPGQQLVLRPGESKLN
ncbi:MAG: LysM peptidoglycan-binding domain-containing protein, partial [Gammaproteobacteria bacterium]|nr:LysM peptidoglycan-binding domain-containing protein [Gammaproteobacteria bacterium]